MCASAMPRLCELRAIEHFGPAVARDVGQVSFILILICLAIAMDVDDLALHQARLLLLIFGRRPALLDAETLEFFLIHHLDAFDQL